MYKKLYLRTAFLRSSLRMTSLTEFSLPIQGLTEGQHEFNFQIDKDFFKHFESSPIQQSDIQVRLDFDKRPDMFVMDFQISGTANIECDRCLELFDFPLDVQNQLLVKKAEEVKEDLDIIYIIEGSPSLNVAKYIYEFICLAIPMSKVHEDADLECNKEMLRYIQSEDSPKEESKSDEDKPSIWEALKKFNKN